MTAAFKRSRTRILVAFAAVYVLWGSTYLFIKYTVETIPPFLLGVTRFVLAGAILYVAARARGAPRATAAEWRVAIITGVLMLGVGNGAVMSSARYLPSGVIALIVATVPLWMAVFDWLRPSGSRPGVPVFVGIVLGLVGMATLIGPDAIRGRGPVDPLWAVVLLMGSVSWALGSIVTRAKERPRSPLVSTAIQMLAAGAAFIVPMLATGELGRFSIDAVSERSLIGLLYLVFCGSLLGFTAYIYLLSAVSAAKAATYAYVNPVIAVLLGWAFANEPLSARTLFAAAIILAGVAIITATQGSAVTPTGEHPVGAAEQQERSAA